MTAPFVRPLLSPTYDPLQSHGHSVGGPSPFVGNGALKMRHNSDSRIDSRIVIGSAGSPHTGSLHAPSHHVSTVSGKRSKVSRACDECRRRKTRCDIDLQPEGCSSCRRAKVDCTFERTQLKRGPSKRPRSLSTNAVTGPGATSAVNLSAVASSLASLRSAELKAAGSGPGSGSPNLPQFSANLHSHSPQSAPMGNYTSQEKLPGIGALLAWSSGQPDQVNPVPIPASPAAPPQQFAGSAPVSGTLPILVEVACAQPSMSGMSPFPIMAMGPPASPQSPSRYGYQQPTAQISNLQLGPNSPQPVQDPATPTVSYLSAQYMVPQPAQVHPQPQVQAQAQLQPQVQAQAQPQPQAQPQLQQQSPASLGHPHRNLSLNPHDAQVLTEYYTWWHPVFPVLPSNTDELVQLLSNPDSRGLINAMTGAVSTLPVPIHQDRQSRHIQLIQLIFLYLRSLEYSWLGAAAANVISMLSTDQSPQTQSLFAIVAALDRLHSLTHNTTPLVGHRDGLAHLNSPPGSESLVKVLRALELLPANTPSTSRETRGWLSPPPEHGHDAIEAALHWLTRLKDTRAKSELRQLLPSLERTPLASFVRVATM